MGYCIYRGSVVPRGIQVRRQLPRAPGRCLCSNNILRNPTSNEGSPPSWRGADRESRVMLDLHNWKLDALLFAELNHIWGPLGMGLFAPHLST